MVVYATRQRELVGSLLGRAPEVTVLSPFMVDTAFFSPAAVVARQDRMICAAGLELRDYRTLVDAVRGLDVRVVIAAGSPWSTRPDTVRDDDVPANVEVCTLDFVALRQLYADARLVVMPLQDVDFQAGITTILEAMAMGKAVVCSQTRGQTDTIVHERTGLYVPPGDATALRSAIERLLDEPELADALGAAARRWTVEHADVGVYAERLGGHVDRLRAATT
jgi:glycosyltransferase involved in cell wall biosynthesis